MSKLKKGIRNDQGFDSPFFHDNMKYDLRIYDTLVNGEIEGMVIHDQNEYYTAYRSPKKDLDGNVIPTDKGYKGVIVVHRNKK